MAALAARREGARYTANQGRVSRPCEPDDVVKCLDALYRRRRIDLVHARILRIWGERQATPNPAYLGERCDWRLWREALDKSADDLSHGSLVYTFTTDFPLRLCVSAFKTFFAP